MHSRQGLLLQDRTPPYALDQAELVPDAELQIEDRLCRVDGRLAQAQDDLRTV